MTHNPLLLTTIFSSLALAQAPSTNAFTAITVGQNLPPGSQSIGFQLTSISGNKATGIWLDALNQSHALIYDIPSQQWSLLPGGNLSAALATDGVHHAGWVIEPGVGTGTPSQYHCITWTDTPTGIQGTIGQLKTFLGTFLGLLAQSWCTTVDNGTVGGVTYNQIDLQLRPEDAIKQVTQSSWAFISDPGLASPIGLGDPTCCSIVRGSSNGVQVGQVSFVPVTFTANTPVFDPQVGSVIDSSPVSNPFVHAAVWHGTPTSFVDLHPAGALASTALTTDGARQGGWISNNNVNTTAALWSGTAASFTALAAPGYSDTRVTGICSNFIVGDGWLGGAANTVGATRHGLLWNGPSVLDLNSGLPAGYTNLAITGISSDCAIVGYAQQSFNGLPTISNMIGIILMADPGTKVGSMTFNPPSVTIGSASTGTVTLQAPAPAGGVTITFISNNPNWVPSPAAVSIPQGQTAATFSVPTNGNAFFPGSSDANGNFTPNAADLPITAYSGFSTFTATLNVKSQIPADPIASITLTPSALTDGASTTATVTLTGPAPAGGVNVAFSSSAPYLLTPPLTNLTVPAGQNSASFTAGTLPGAFNPFSTNAGKITIAAATGAAQRSATLTGSQIPLASLTVTPPIIAPGSSSTATVTLAAPAPAGGVSVYFQPSDATKLSIAGSVLVPAGQTTASLPVSATTVSFCCTNYPKPVSLSASANGADIQQAAITIQPNLQIDAFYFDDQFGLPFAGPLTGGTNAFLTVRFNYVTSTTAGNQVTLSSTNPAIIVPPSVTLYSNGGTLVIPILAPPALTTGVVTATVNGISTSFTISVAASPQPTIRSLSIPFVSSGQTFTGTLTLSGGALLGGATITLTSSNPSVAPIPSTLTIPMGGTTATFTGTAGTVAGATAVTITATFNGLSTNGALSVLPGPVLAINSYTLNPYTTIGPGVATTGTITLNQPAPAGGVTVALSASNSQPVGFPSSVTVPQGQTSASFSVKGSSVSGTVLTTLIATYTGPLAPLGPVSASTGVTVSPTDTLHVTSATWSKSTQTLAVSATSTNPQAIITVLNANGNAPLGAMTNAGNGIFNFQTTVATISSVNIKSNLGGSTGQGVSVVP